MKFNVGDMVLVSAVNHETGEITLMRWGDVFGPAEEVEIVRIENEHGQVAYLSRAEYEGRRDGTWQTYDLMGSPLPLKRDDSIAKQMESALDSTPGKGGPG